MCWMAAIPAAMSVLGGIQQGNAQSAQAYTAASNARTNAAYANDAANDALRRGAYEGDLQRLKTRQSIGTQRAAMASNGGEVNSGSNAQIQQDTAALGELDALTIQNNAAREAYGYKAQALSGYANARQLEVQSDSVMKNSILGGVIKGAGSYFGSTGGLGSSSLNYNQAYV